MFFKQTISFCFFTSFHGSFSLPLNLPLSLSLHSTPIHISPISVKSSSSNYNNKITYSPPPAASHKSFVLATGELVLGIASRLLHSGGGNKNGSFSSSGVSLIEKSNGKRVVMERLRILRLRKNGV